MIPRRDALLRNPKLLFWAKSLLGISALNAVIVFFYLHRGLSIDQIFYLSIVWSIATIVFEIPTGFLADRFGRKRMLILGASIEALVCITLFFAHGFPQFIGLFVLMSLAFACASGTEEALVYDSLKEAGSERDTTRQIGRLMSADHWLSIFIPALGALIAKDFLEWQFQILIGVNLAGTLGAALLLCGLSEPRHALDVLGHERNIFTETWTTLRERPVLLRAGLNKVTLFVASFITWRAYQPVLGSVGVSALALSAFYVCMKLGTFLVSWYAGRIEERFGAVRIFDATAAAMIVLGFLASFSHSPTLIFLGFLGSLIVYSVREPLFAKALNRHIASGSRATTLSHLNMLKAFVDIPILLLSGYLAQTNLRAPVLIGVAMAVFVLLFLRVRASDLKRLTINPDEVAEAPGM